MGYAGSTALLEDPKVREFIETIRKRDSIILPVTHDAIEPTLEEHPPQDYFDEALPVAEDYWQRLALSDVWFRVRRALFLRVCAMLRRLAPDKVPDVDPLDSLPLDEFARTSAQIIARYIVLDLLEIPQPINYPLALVRTERLGDDPVLLAMVHPGANLDDVFCEMRRQYAEIKAECPLARPPDNTRETVWLRHCARTLEARGQLPPRSRNRILAEYSFEIHPHLRPDAETGTDAHNQALAKEADRIRKSGKNFDGYTAQIQDDPEDADPLSEI